MPSHPLVAGIDLGTTNSAIAVVIDGELKVLPVHGQLTMPSVVGLDPAGRLIIGRAAKNQEVSAPEDTVLSIKRHMGTGHVSILGGRSYSPEEISALILGELQREAEKHLGQEIRQAVITVPAFFNEQQRKATQAAGHLAGFEVLRIINEPTAAALAYGAGAGDNEGQTMLVYDLGGGTFDVSLVRVDNGIVEVKASHGDTHLGGDDFDNLLVGMAAERFAGEHGAAALPEMALRRLKGVMEQAKIQLSDDPYATVAEEYLDASRHLRTEVARSDYEELIVPLLEKTLDCLHRALHDAGVTPREVDRIMLVGGATRTPLVHQVIAARMNMNPRHEINPDLIVAMGAAIQGAALGGQPAPAILIDITAHSYRLEILSDHSMLVCAPLIPRGTSLPVRRAESYATTFDNQERVVIKVFQGEGLFAHENTLLGEFTITGLSKKPAGNPVIVQFQLDLNGLLTATATEKLTGLVKAITIDTRGQHRLNLDAARANLDALFADQREEDAALIEDEEFGEDDDFKVDDEDYDDEDVIEAVTGEIAKAPGDAATPAPPGLIASARSLRQRAEALLANGVAEKDAADIRQLLNDATTALKARQWSALQRHADSLSDIIFYLED